MYDVVLFHWLAQNRDADLAQPRKRSMVIRPFSLWRGWDFGTRLFTALPGCCSLCRTTFSNFVHMSTCLVSRQKTTVTGLGARLVNGQNHELTSAWLAWSLPVVVGKLIPLPCTPRTAFSCLVIAAHQKKK